MIGQEGTREQLEQYIMNRPPATIEQIRKTTKPIRDYGTTLKKRWEEWKTKGKGVWEDLKKGTITLFTLVIVSFILYIIAKNQD